MNKEQQELSEPTMGAELPPLTETAERNIDHDDFYFAFCQRNTELIAALKRERELQDKIKRREGWLEEHGDIIDDLRGKLEAAESQLLAKDALIASLKSEISVVVKFEMATQITKSVSLSNCIFFKPGGVR